MIIEYICYLEGVSELFLLKIILCQEVVNIHHEEVILVELLCIISNQIRINMKVS